MILYLLPDVVAHWLNNAFAKIVVSVNSEEELLNVYNKAKDAGIACSLIQDAGRTEFKGSAYLYLCRNWAR